MTDEKIIDIGSERFAETIHQIKAEQLLPGLNNALASGAHPVLVVAAMLELIGETVTALRCGGDQDAARLEVEELVRSYLADWRENPIPSDEA